MEIFLIVLLVITGLVSWILLAPIVITIDSQQGIYQIAIRSIGKVDFTFNNDLFYVTIKTFIVKKEIKIDPFKSRKVKDKSKTTKKRKGKRTWRRSATKGLSIARSFDLQRLWLNIDTGDHYYNSYLYPIFYFIRGRHHQLAINYSGNNEVVLVVSNRLITILYHLIR